MIQPQPTPKVTQADVERLARRDYPEDQVAQVLRVLDEYGTAKWEVNTARVRAAILKLAKGDSSQVNRFVEAARTDFRDVLSEAEYPSFTKRWGDRYPLAKEEQQRVIEEDRRQYQDWFRKE